MGFLDSLRMNGLFSGSGSNSSQSLGPPIDSQPNFDAIAHIINLVRGPMTEDRNANWNREDNMMAKQHQDRLKEIAASLGSQSNQPTPPMNTVLAPSGISPLDKAKLDLESKDLNRKTSADKNREEIQREGIGVRQQNADTSSSRADTYHKIMDRNDLTASQKLTLMNEERLKEVNARIGGSKDVEAMRETAASQRQDTRGKQQTSNIETRGEQTRQTNSEKPDRANTPVQNNRDQMNKARQIVNTDQELGQFVKIDDKGNFTVTQPGTAGGPSLDQFSRLNKGIYGSDAPSGDVSLDSKDKKKSKVPESPNPDYEYVPKAGGGYTAVKKGTK